jgi:hypothetical protein
MQKNFFLNQFYVFTDLTILFQIQILFDQVKDGGVVEKPAASLQGCLGAGQAIFHEFR